MFKKKMTATMTFEQFCRSELTVKDLTNSELYDVIESCPFYLSATIYGLQEEMRRRKGLDE